MIPYPETMMEPNRTQFLALGAIVGRGKIAGPEKWPEWDRLVDKYGWKTLLKSADRCDPINRWSANIEAICAQLKSSDIEAEKESDSRARISATPKPQNRAECSARFAEILKSKGLR